VCLCVCEIECVLRVRAYMRVCLVYTCCVRIECVTFWPVRVLRICVCERASEGEREREIRDRRVLCVGFMCEHAYVYVRV
jgi:hypothetical protein